MNEPKHLEIARAEMDVAEIPGPETNECIAAYQATVGIHEGDETPWCSAFVNWCLEQAGIAGTGKPNARSWLAWGTPINLEDAQPGDVCIFWRGNPVSWRGHVAFFLGCEDGEMVHVLGGNQCDCVSEGNYPIDRLLGIRRAVLE